MSLYVSDLGDHIVQCTASAKKGIHYNPLPNIQ